MSAPKMTLQDLRVSVDNMLNGHWADIEREDDGEIVIRTRLVENEHGELISVDDA